MKPVTVAPTFSLLPPPSFAAEPAAHTFVPGRAAREEILHRAYALWEQEGYPADRKLQNWLQAEAEVLHPVQK